VNSIRVVEDEMSIKLVEVEPCHESTWNEMKDIFQSLDVRNSLRQRSESFKNEVSSGMASHPSLQWEKSSIFHDSGLLDVPAIYRLDGRGSCSGACGSRHKMNLVLCLNNRESIGTNFMKLEIAAQEDIRNQKGREIFDKNILGILVTFNEGLLKAGGWDASYASSDEYTFAYKHAYRQIIRSNIVGMQLHLI